MRKRAERLMRHRVVSMSLIFTLCLALMNITGCKKTAAHGLPGEYVSAEKQGGKMVITTDTIQADVGQLFFSVKYKTVSTSGEITTLEIDDGMTSKTQLMIQQSDDTLTIRNNYVLNGTWKRK